MNSKNIKSLLFVVGTAFAIFIFTASFTACSSHILDMTEGLQSASTPTQPSSTPETTPETTPPPEPTPTPTPTPTPAPTPTAYSITVTSGEHGTISVDKTNAAAGETITITVTPEAGYEVDVLLVADEGGNSITVTGNTFTMPAGNVYVNGTFKSTSSALVTYRIIFTASVNGWGSVNKTTAAAGETITITLHPFLNYELDTLSVTDANGNSITVSGAYTFIMPASNVSINCSFKVITYSIILTNSTHGTFSVDKTIAAYRETVTITVNPDNDYVLDAITVTDANGNSVYVNTNNNTFFMPESNVTVNCTFRVRQLLIYTLLGYRLCKDLQANSTATSFVHSTTPPASGTTTYILSDYNSDVELVAWLEGTTIKFYAEGYTDSNRKIPLPADSKYLFQDCSSLQVIDTEVFDTAAVTDMGSMFDGCENLTTLNLSGFDTAAVTDMKFMFSGCKKLETIVFSNKFLTSNVETMAMMFSNCESLTSLDLSSFDTSNVTDMMLMFAFDYSLTTIFVGDDFDTSNVTNSDNMFGPYQSLVGGGGTKFSYLNPTDKTYARIDDPANGNPGYFTRK